MRAAGVRQVVDAAGLNVVGIAEVVTHIPRIYKEFQRLRAAARELRPSLAILTDSPDFHLRLAAKLHDTGIPVVYLVAPQVWAWRANRIPAMRRNISRLLCIFPFEEEFFAGHGVPADYIGHPLTRIVRPSMSREEFWKKHRLTANRPLVTLLPGSRPGEIARHLRILPAAVDRLNRQVAANFILATPAGLREKLGKSFFEEPIGGSPIQHVEGETWDAVAHSDLALAASGTVTVEAAILGTPMVVFYKVSPLSWWMGRHLVKVPYFSMVNLVAGRRIVPELIQNEASTANLAAAAADLLADRAARERMKEGLADVVAKLASAADPMERAAGIVSAMLSGTSPGVVAPASTIGQTGS
jgi:lipid-A-disaccharide synthase